MKIAFLCLLCVAVAFAQMGDLPEEALQMLMMKLILPKLKMMILAMNTMVEYPEVCELSCSEKLEKCYGMDSELTMATYAAAQQCFPPCLMDLMMGGEMPDGESIEKMLCGMFDQMMADMCPEEMMANVMMMKAALGDQADAIACSFNTLMCRMSEMLGVDLKALMEEKMACVAEQMGDDFEMPDESCMAFAGAVAMVGQVMQAQKCFFKSLGWLNEDCSICPESIQASLATTVYADAVADLQQTCEAKTSMITADCIAYMSSGAMDDMTWPDVCMMVSEHMEEMAGRQMDGDDDIAMCEGLMELFVKSVQQFAQLDCIYLGMEGTCYYTVTGECPFDMMP